MRIARSFLTRAAAPTTRLGLGCLLLLFLAAAPLHAQPFPRVRLTRVMPMGAQAGTSVEVALDGANLDDAEALYFSQPGIKAERLADPAPKIDPKTKKRAKAPPVVVRFKVTVPAKTPIGIVDVRVIAKLGVSNPRAFVIGALPEIVESEPNQDVPEAQKIELNATVNGTISTKLDVDYYRFAGKKGQHVVVRCAGWSIDSKLSPMVQMFDEKGVEIFAQHRINDDVVAAAVLPRDADYTIRVCQFAYQYGAADTFYRLSISEAPWLAIAYPPVVEAGKTTPVEVYGRNLPDGVLGPKTLLDRPLEKAIVKVAAPAETSDALAYRGFLLPKTLGLHGTELRIPSPHGVSNPLLMTVCRCPVAVEKDANDSPDAAQELTIPTEVCGRIEKRSDRDWYTFATKKGEALSFECFADRLGAPVDLYMQIWRTEPRQLIGEYDDHAELPAQVGQFWMRTEDPKTRFVPPADGKYLLMVSSRTAAMRAGPRLVYRLSAHRAEPDFHVILIDNQDGGNGGFTLEQGGNQEFGVLCLREDGFDGEVLLQADGLPPGVTCEPQVVGPDVSQSVLVLRAAKDAPMTFGTFRVKATATIGGTKIERQAQAGSLVWANAQKNAATHSRLARSLCLAVRAPGPFTLDAPVRVLTAAAGAKVEVKVRTQRSGPDFKAPVAVTRLAGPVAQGGKAITIPAANINANQTEAAIKFQLPANTPPGRYSLVFQGKGKVSYRPNPKDKKKINVDFLTATPPITLTVFNTVAELTLGQPGITLKPGGSGAIAVKIKRLHQFDGPIQIELIPQKGAQGIKGAALTLAAGKSDGQLIVQAPKNAKSAAYPNFIVRASAKFDGVVLKDETKLQVSVSNSVAADGQPLQVKMIPLLPESAPGWRYVPAKRVTGNAWQTLTFDDKNWTAAATPIGYGEPEIARRKGTTIAQQGEPICCRREFMLPADLLATKGVTFQLRVASDDSAAVYLNGQIVDKDDADHEYSYWDRDLVLPAKVLRPGRNVVAVRVNNSAGSSDLYLDLAILAQTPVAKKK